MRAIRGNQSGATLVETLIVFVLIALSATALYPIFTRTKEVSKLGDARELCNSFARAKLDEYRNGRPISLPNAAAALGNANIANLTLSNLSDSGMTGVGTGGSAFMGSGGFTFAKVRYNAYFPDICTSATPSQAAVLAALPVADRSFGVRECLGGDPMLLGDTFVDAAGAASALYCANKYKQDRDAMTQLPGFRLYVKLELDTPWRLGNAAAADPRYSNTCPNRGGAGRFYDFDGANDGIKVTVTGVIDPPAVMGTFAGIPLTATDRLTCQVSSTLRGDTQAIRYYLSTDGMIYSASGKSLTGSSNTAGAKLLFNNLYSSTARGLSTGILGFAVHPRNLAIYVLKSGQIIRYSDCGGDPLDCATVNNATNGFTDDGSAAMPGIVQFTVPASIGQIAVNFRSGMVFGMTRDHSAINKIQTTIGPPGGVPAIYTGMLGFANVTPVGTPATLAQMTMAAAGAADGAFMTNTNLGGARRLTGFFIEPGGGEAFVSDLSVSTVLGGSRSSTVYRLSDVELGEPVLTLGVGAIAFSR